MDDREVADDLICIGVPLRDPDGRVIAAVSRSAPPPAPVLETTLEELQGCAAEIAERLFSPSTVRRSHR
jgi:DNA-binding IclR family transcriptional regulator